MTRLPTPEEVARQGIATWKAEREPCVRCGGCGEELEGDELSICSVCDGSGESIDVEVYVAREAYEAVAALMTEPAEKSRVLGSELPKWYDVIHSIRQALSQSAPEREES